MTDPHITAIVDQIETARREAQRVWPYNWFLPAVDEFFQGACRLAVRPQAWATPHNALPDAPAVRFVLGGQHPDGARPIDTVFDERRPEIPAECSRCVSLNRCGISFETAFESLVIASGSCLVMFSMCDTCQAELTSDYPDIVWGVPRNGAL